MVNEQHNDYNARANDMTRISASRTDFIEDTPDPGGPTEPIGVPGPDIDGWDHEPTSETYHDDFDNANDAVDPFMDETTDDPTKELGIPPEEYKAEMDKLALDELEYDHEDTRETLEDRDEADDSSAAYA